MLVSINNGMTTNTATIAAGIQLAENFKLSEMANTSGDPALPEYIFSRESDAFMQALQFFRDEVQLPVNVNSGYRQKEYNKKVGGDSNSLHLVGCAADIQPVRGLSRDQHIQYWINALEYLHLIGAINIYPDKNYYHLEAGSDIYLGYKKNTIRVYSTQALWNEINNKYKRFDVDVMRCK